MKQVFTGNTVMRRVLCAVLVAVMVFAMIPAVAPEAEAVSAGQTLYFKAGDSSISAGGAWFAAHFFNNSGSNTVKMTYSSSTGLWSCTVPSGGYTSVVFMRMNPNVSTPSWDNGLWNQSVDLVMPTDGKNCFVANKWNNGKMDGYWNTVQETTYYLAGFINGADLGIGSDSSNLGSYAFSNNKLTVTFTETSYVIIKDNSGNQYWAQNYISSTSGTFYKDKNYSEKMYVPANIEVTFTLVKNSDGSLSLSYTTGGGSGSGGAVGTVVDLNTGTFTKDSDKLYIGTTFYDYYSDWEMDGKNLDSRPQFNIGWDGWYIFNKFNTALSSYYQSKSAKVPIYIGHFQPEWKDSNGSNWGWQFMDSPTHNLYGFMDGKAYYTTDTNQKWFMSVNNGWMNADYNVTGNHINAASWGIVANALNSDKDVVAAGSSTVLPFFNKSFINGTNTLNKKLGDVYENVQFPFTKEDLHGNGIQYWVFDSDKTTLEMKKDTAANLYYLDDITATRTGRYKNMDSSGAVQEKYGFFPFNEGASSSNVNTYNYGFGTRLDIPFNLTYDGKVADKYGDKQDIVFEFSGDDDVWVFIDGKLVLDIGGSHGKVTGTINFASKVATVSEVKTSGGDHNTKGTNVTKNFTIEGNMTDEHTLTMFYMERGMWESNMKVAFNFIPAESLLAPTTSFTVQKQWNVAQGSNVPDSISVQLQRSIEGSNEWAAVENVTLNKPSSSTDNVWSYTWNDIDRYTNNDRTTLYEYRVVELNSDDSVLANGQFGPNGMLVAYGEVYGNAATGFGQIISNNQVSNNIVVVIDFGLSVDVTVIDQGKGNLYGVGNPLKVPVGTSSSLSNAIGSSFEGKHGVATVSGNKIRYTPSNMKMDSADNIAFCYKPTNGSYTYSTLTVIPAANIYYEDSFLSFTDSSAASNGYGKWVIEGSVADKIQAEDRPGELSSYDANNVYGYDAAYSSFTMYSLGSARKVTVDADTGKPTTAPTAVFSFTGTGFDVVSLTDSDSGAIAVEVKDAKGKIVKSYIVNNYYGMVFNTTTQSWEIAKDNSGYVLYQVPVIKVFDLPYGTYDVTIKAAYLPNFDKDRVGHYTIWLDAIRIYDPALNDATSNDAYDKDGESNPHLTTVKKLLVNPNDFGGNLDGNKNIVNGVVYVEGKDKNVTMAEYAHQGPNNETYLMNGNGIGFKLRYFGTSQPNISLQIGAKLAVGSEATLKCDGKKLVTLKTATNMFYKLPAVTWTKVSNGIWESSAILLSCTAGQNDILSLTDLKVTGADAAYITNSAATSAPETAQLLAVVDMDVQNLAVLVLSASEDVTDPTEPETDPTEPETDPTEPETDPTEPETDPTEPETDPTEPETDPTEPETDPTEPETTVPATTAPEKDPDNAQTGDAFGQNLPVFAVAAFLSLLAFLFMAAYASRRTERD